MVHDFPCAANQHNESLCAALTALSVTLEEVCFARPLKEQISSPSTDVECDQRLHESDMFAAAHRLLGRVQSTMGTLYYRVVKDCMALSLQADRENEEELWQDFFGRVMLPLQKLWGNMEAIG